MRNQPKLFVFSFLFVLMGSSLALADFNTDAKYGEVDCTGDDGTSVTISADRSLISILSPGDDGHLMDYTVSIRTTDGDSYAAYSAADDEGNPITFVLADDGAYFSNMGDALQYGSGEPGALTCK